MALDSFSCYYLLGLMLVWGLMTARCSSVQIRNATVRAAALKRCSQMLSTRLEPLNTDTEYTTELFSMKARGVLQMTENYYEPLAVVYWEERDVYDARLCLDRDEIPMATGLLYDGYITIRTPKAKGNVRYLAVDYYKGYIYLTFKESRTPNTYWKWDLLDGGTYIRLYHNVTTQGHVPYYIAVGRGGDIYLTSETPDPSDKRFIFNRCQAQVLTLADATYITYDTCFWTGPKMTDTVMEEYDGCLRSALR